MQLLARSLKAKKNLTIPNKEQEYQECCGCETWIVALALCLGIAGVGFAYLY
ncbi:hypothetical protein RchiOBHm_Chr7g0183551 [Rosa chinensis]|uniref:Uncharacterized protein n=1 Tax=Rosa chinensis TaxID=74649 RepID=A0A2P6P364_ROSCH|nr:hypothetical protein RchiOBHm_Chr7g0183551 [Rosa chinensis]